MGTCHLTGSKWDPTDPGSWRRKKAEKYRNLSSTVGFRSETQNRSQNKNFPKMDLKNIGLHLRKCPKNLGCASNLTPRIWILRKCLFKVTFGSSSKFDPKKMTHPLTSYMAESLSPPPPPTSPRVGATTLICT